ncbi:MAG: exosortase/archaeosortase family protein [Thermoguttaceae bacterium]
MRTSVLRKASVVAALAVLFTWSYWPTLWQLAATWVREPDYSHGFFVAPLALYFLWARRDRMPAYESRIHWAGLAPLAASVAIRVVGARYYLEAFDGWSVMFWVAGVVWLFCGLRILVWSLPAILFLWFMVRLPYRLELGLSLPLQTIATNVSCWALQVLGQPALPEGHTIVLGDHTLEVEQACSGLRIFMGIAALASAYVVLSHRLWWERTILLLSAVPIAVVANVSRVVVTSLLFQYAETDAAKKFSHDAAGWLMIPFAAALFALVLWWLGKSWSEVELVGVDAVAGRRSRRSGGPMTR